MSDLYRQAAGITPTPQEKLLIMLGRHAYDAAISQILENLRLGYAPSMLSVARPDILFGFAEAWHATKPSGTEADTPDTYKIKYFDHFAELAADGDPAATTALPKFATKPSQLTIFATLALANRKRIEAWHGGRSFIQYLGTFDPQHIGHRIAVQSALMTEGEQSSAILHVMGQHPRKKTFSAPYETRYKESEERFYKSPLLDNTRITQIDLPGGVGFAETYPLQMELLATFSGDDQYRWLTGSDKLLLDAHTIQRGESADKAIARFSDPKMHAYIVHRQSDSRTEVENSIDYVSNRFGTNITLVEELPYDCAPASSSRIKQLRAEGRLAEARHMELYELA